MPPIASRPLVGRNRPQRPLRLSLPAQEPDLYGVAIVSLALGIGINTFLFSVFSSLILRPLPIADPAGVTFIESTAGSTFSFPDYKDFRDRNQTFSGLAGYRISVMNFEHSGEPSRMWCYLATGNYFDLLGVKPAMGRFFHQADDLQPGASPYVVLSYASWLARFAGDLKRLVRVFASMAIHTRCSESPRVASMEPKCSTGLKFGFP